MNKEFESYHVVADTQVDRVSSKDGESVVTRFGGYIHNGSAACVVQDTGNGYVARFPSDRSTRQDYYLCLDYDQARNLVLALSAFKHALGFGA